MTKRVGATVGPLDSTTAMFIVQHSSAVSDPTEEWVQIFTLCLERAVRVLSRGGSGSGWGEHTVQQLCVPVLYGWLESLSFFVFLLVFFSNAFPLIGLLTLESVYKWYWSHLLLNIRFKNKSFDILQNKLGNLPSYFVIRNKITWHWNRNFLGNVKELSRQ